MKRQDSDPTLTGLHPAVRQCRQLLDVITDFLTRETQFVEALQIEPKFGACAEPVTEPQRGVGRYATLTVDDSGDPVHRHINLVR